MYCPHVYAYHVIIKVSAITQHNALELRVLLRHTREQNKCLVGH